MTIRVAPKGQIIDKKYIWDPLFPSAETIDKFYELIIQNLNSPDLVIKRSKPDVWLFNFPCRIYYIYDVALLGKHFCTLYQDANSSVTGAAHRFRTIEISGQHYDMDDIMRVGRSIDNRRYNIGKSILERWESDEQARLAAARSNNEKSLQSFVASFQR